MPIEDPNDLERADRKIRINEMKERLNEIAGGKMITGGTDEMPDEIAEQFWERVLAYETAPMTTNLEQLRRIGVEVPAPDTLDDRTLSEKLREVVDALAQLRSFLVSTDHLSDRELYARLYEESLREEVPDLPPDDDGGAYFIDMAGSGDEEDTRAWLTYYADEETRAAWVKDFPDYDLPPARELPFDRDRHLPKPGQPRDREEG